MLGSGVTVDLVRGVWSDVLGLHEDRGDDFFACGGDSIAAARCTIRLSEALGVEVPFALIFEHPRLSDYAEAVRASAHGTTPPSARNIPARPEGMYPLPDVLSQTLTWLYQQDQRGLTVPANVIVMPIALRAPVSDVEIQRALDRLVDRHEALRTGFTLDVEGRPTPFLSAFGSVEIGKVNSVSSDWLASSVRAALAQRFELTSPPLMSVATNRLAPDDVTVLIGVDHSVFDGASALVFFEEFVRLLDDPDADLPPARQVGDWASWQAAFLAGPDRQHLLSFWRRYLAGTRPLPALNLATQERPGEGSVQAHALTLQSGSSAELRRFASAHTATPFMVLLTGIARACAVALGLEDLVIHTPTSNRWSPDVERIVGFVVHSTLVRIGIPVGEVFDQTLTRTRRSVLEALTNSHLPLPTLLRELQPGLDPTRRLGRIFFAFEDLTDAVLPLKGGKATLVNVPADYARGTVADGFTISALDCDGAISIRLITPAGFSTTVAEELLACLDHEFRFLAG